MGIAMGFVNSAQSAQSVLLEIFCMAAGLSQQSAVSSQSPPQSRSYCVAALALLTVELQLALPGSAANTSSSRKYFSEKYLKDILVENI